MWQDQTRVRVRKTRFTYYVRERASEIASREVAQQVRVKKRTPGTPSDNAHEDSITTSYQRRRSRSRRYSVRSNTLGVCVRILEGRGRIRQGGGEALCG